MESELSEKYRLLKKIVDLEIKLEYLKKENKELKEQLDTPITQQMMFNFFGS
tara:strand:+ start:232 stop:387 length:156 start_codon:yes stop_codon:yes gene_type:complete